MHKKSKSGFTLVELLVVIGIIGILTTFVLINLSSAREKSKIARVQADLRQLHTGIEELYFDTGRYPNGEPEIPCVNEVDDNEIFLNTCEAGLACEDGNFSNWDGPYVGNVTADPWGSDYLYDTDYQCFTDIQGCELFPDGEQVRALVSFGPNMKGINVYDEDDIVLVVCK